MKNNLMTDPSTYEIILSWIIKGIAWGFLGLLLLAAIFGFFNREDD